MDKTACYIIVIDFLLMVDIQNLLFSFIKEYLRSIESLPDLRCLSVIVIINKNVTLYLIIKKKLVKTSVE
jgi:hypothetical protein